MSTDTDSKIPAVYNAIQGVMRNLGIIGIDKNNTNQNGRYKYRGIDDVYNALNKALSDNNLVLIPNVISREQSITQTKQGGSLKYVVVEVEFSLVCSIDGSSHKSKFSGEAMDTSDKATNKAITAAYKYFCFLTFCIPLEGQEDADAHNHKIPPIYDQISAARSEDDLNALIPQCGDDRNVKRAIHQKAQELGLTFSNSEKRYVLPENDYSGAIAEYAS